MTAYLSSVLQILMKFCNYLLSHLVNREGHIVQIKRLTPICGNIKLNSGIGCRCRSLNGDAAVVRKIAIIIRHILLVDRYTKALYTQAHAIGESNSCR